MSDDVFRSEAPPVAALADESGGEATGSAQPATAFAPLDEPPQLSEIDIPADTPGGAGSVTASEPAGLEPGQVPVALPDAADGSNVEASDETPEGRARLIRKLSPELLVRAIEIHEETEYIAAEIERVEVLLPGFDASASPAPEASGVLPSEPSSKASTKESK
jgi:hypothetical protein